jgi:transaldolase/glucose-6-phosphate isomerase
MTQDASGPAAMDFPLICTQGDLEVRADAAGAAALVDPSAESPSLSALLAAHLARARPGDYAALLAYLPRNRATESQVAALRGAIAAKYGIATCAGFGPRFLHSTGQLHKGGANRGIFIQITADHAADIAVPGTGHTFGQVQAAQAMGDLAVLAQRERRLLWIHLGPGARPGDITAALA